MPVFNCLIYRYTTQEDIIVGSYISQTNNLDFNILAFRNYISGSSSFSQLLKQHEQAVSQDLEYQDFSWKQLVQELIPNNPGIFQVMFNLQDALLIDTPLPININEYELDLSFFVVSSKEGLKGTVVYNQELFEPQTIQRMIGHFENLLNSI
ncbi:MAG: condensation domain-containing protein, partial [Cyanobacteria bacterium J06636_27]